MVVLEGTLEDELTEIVVRFDGRDLMDQDSSPAPDA